MTVTDTIRESIKTKHIVEFTYDGRQRIAEPHVLGIINGEVGLLIYQTGGQSSSGGLPNWRLVKIDKIIDYNIINETFPGKRSTPTSQHTDFDTILELVD